MGLVGFIPPFIDRRYTNEIGNTRLLVKVKKVDNRVIGVSPTGGHALVRLPKAC